MDHLQYMAQRIACRIRTESQVQNGSGGRDCREALEFLFWLDVVCLHSGIDEATSEELRGPRAPQLRKKKRDRHPAPPLRASSNMEEFVIFCFTCDANYTAF